MRFCLYIVLVLISTLSYAQEVLTPQQAIAVALKNNYDIKLAQNNLKIDEQNVSLANAGLLPNISGTFSQNNSIQNSKQVRSDGTVQEQDNARNNSMNYGVNLGWTIFDGFRMFARYDQLQEFQKQGETELKLMILTRVSNVMTTYFDLVQQQQMITVMDTAIVISKQRVTTANNRFKIGKAAKLEVLNAQVDLNTDQTNFLRQKELYENTKTYLNELLARELTTKFKVIDSVTIDNKLQLVDLMNIASQQNPQIQLALINKRIAEFNLKQTKGTRYPQVAVNTGYVFNNSQSSLGFAQESNSRGLNYGLSASINIFNGFLQSRNEKIAKIQIDNSKIFVDQQRQTINSQLISAFQTYLANLELVGLEATNEDIARQNLDITLEKYRIGTITQLEVRAAQLNYVNARVRSSSAQFQAKNSEITLKQLAGNVTFLRMDIEKLKAQIEEEINCLISKVDDVPSELIPRVNKSNDFACPFIDISSEGDLYYVVRERGVELERSIQPDIDWLLKKIFIDLSFGLASKKVMEERKSDEDYSFEKIKNIQKEYLKMFNPEWDL